MEKYYGVFAVALIAILILAFTELRKKRMAKSLTAFRDAYCDIAARLVPSPIADSPAYTSMEGRICLLPAERQPDSIRALLEAGVDAQLMSRLAELREARAEAEQHLTVVNLLSKQVKPVLARCTELTELAVAVVRSPSALTQDKELEAFRYYLSEQEYIKKYTLGVLPVKAE